MDSLELFILWNISRLILLYFGYKLIQMLYWWIQLLSFKVTEGKIIRDGIKESVYYYRGRKVAYREQLQYQYIVNEQQYVAHSISKVDDNFLRRGNYGRSKRTAEYWNNLYPVGRSVKVYYDPKNPTRAYLYKTVFDKNTAVFLATWFVIEIMILLIIVFSS